MSYRSLRDAKVWIEANLLVEGFYVLGVLW
jgi:hypothetical protein